MISKTQSAFLNLTRWIAAALVLLEHTRSLLFKDFGLLAAPSLVEKGFYFITGFGHESVVIFFVTSGFLVGGKAYDLITGDRFLWRRYLADRASRLYSVVVAALLIGGILDWIGSQHLNSFGFYSNETSSNIAVIAASFADRLTLEHFGTSLLMFQDIWLPPFGSNGPLWSLAHEWWYYILFPMVLFMLRGTPLGRIAFTIMTILLSCLLTNYILILFGVWILGVLGWKANSHRLLPYKITLPLFLATLLLMRMEIHLFPYASQFFLGVGFTLLLNSFVHSQSRWPLEKASKHLADFSYSLYLIHFPVILFATASIFTFFDVQSRFRLDMSSLVTFIFVVFIAYASSFIISLFTEAKTPLFRHRLYLLLGVSK